MRRAHPTPADATCRLPTSSDPPQNSAASACSYSLDWHCQSMTVDLRSVHPCVIHCSKHGFNQHPRLMKKIPPWCARYEGLWPVAGEGAQQHLARLTGEAPPLERPPAPVADQQSGPSRCPPFSTPCLWCGDKCSVLLGVSAGVVIGMLLSHGLCCNSSTGS